MTTLTIDLPEKLAREAQAAGLLSPEALAEILEEAVRRQAGRRLVESARRIHAAGVPPMSDDEIVAEVRAVRAERRARRATADDAGRP